MKKLYRDYLEDFDKRWFRPNCKILDRMASKNRISNAALDAACEAMKQEAYWYINTAREEYAFNKYGWWMHFIDYSFDEFVEQLSMRVNTFQTITDYLR